LLHKDQTDEEIIQSIRVWIERSVIGLNLCPFAKPVFSKGLIRFVVSRVSLEEALLQDLKRELENLAVQTLNGYETVLLIHPNVLSDFLDYNDFLNPAEQLVSRLGLDGIIQIASFHPDYQFAGTLRTDMRNYTNRSPFPLLHLLLEDSIDKAVDSYPDIDKILNRNIKTMNKLGLDGWNNLF